MTEQNWKIGDCLDLMKEMEPDSVDLIVTDPPYGYSFMGKDWDRSVPAVNLWKEALRVLKPGAFAFIMSAPRQDVLSHNLVNLSDAGFNTGFTSIYWTYASGFPKASNIGKMVDKKPNRLFASKMRDSLNKYRINANLTIKEINEYFGFATTGSGVAHHWMISPTQPTIPTQNQYQKLKKLLKINNENLDKIYIEAVREITEYDKNWGNAGSTPLTTYKEFARHDIPVSPQAKALNGSYGGFQPKPAVEVIMVVMKPLSEKTYVDQAMTNQKGITWLDDGRIPFNSDNEPNIRLNAKNHKTTKSAGIECFNKIGNNKRELTKNRSDLSQDLGLHNSKGRFPANLLVCDDVLNNGNTRSSCKSVVDHAEYGDGFKFGGGISNPSNQYSDSGSFSRYFDLDAWWNEQIKHLPKEVQKTFPFMITPKASKNEKMGSTHPTIKPLKLFTYLMTIGSRPGNLVLDPFLGSGTTLQAGRLLDRTVIGYELDQQWETGYNSRIMKNTPSLLSFW